MTLAELNAAAGVEESPYRWRATRRTQISTPDSTKRASRQTERRAQAARNAANDEAVEAAAAKQEASEQKAVEETEAAAEAPTAAPVEPETAKVEEAPVVDQTGKLLAEHGSTMILNPFAVPETAQAVLAQAVARKQEPARRAAAASEADEDDVTSRRRRRRRRGDVDLELEGGSQDDPPNTVTRVRAPRGTIESHASVNNKVASVRGSTRLEAKRQRRRESRETGRRRQVITEAEFLARRESVERKMIVRQREDRIQIGVLEDGVLAEHFVSKTQQDSLIGNVYVGKVQNVLPSMEAAFVDIGRGRNAVLYAGEVNWDVAALEGAPRRIENALKAGDSVLVQVTKDPVGHKGARLTSQISLPGRYLVYVPGGSMTGISRKLPDVERQRLKKILKDHLPENAGVIVRTAAEGASEEELTNDINRLRAQWEGIEEQANSTKTLAPELLYSEPDLTIKVVRDVFNEDFTKLIVSGEHAWDTIEAYVMYVAPDLMGRLEKWEAEEDIFTNFRVDEQIAKALDRKVFLPSGGSLVIDRTEAMTVIDVNTGKFTGSGGNLEETVTKNNLEAAEEVVRQLRLRDIGGIIVIDFIDMVLESNRDLVLRRLVECLGRDRTKHQVAEVTS
ncbi:Rne/Rng family ribonuclease, partial [Glutamicibacter arilaitensis]|uniref:Rne/Rng family ribonuclease n=1 Tax=Glutamicibacter arilaitensis TaxID=256701 RepID=UPI003F8ED892